ncbi:MAG: c-type cytochrome [Lentisphaeraceae bacterium]|nr:c-type cytochrome [Lentisphaeraceae bacterium]
MGNAIGAFERKLVTPSRFDEYLEGNKSALTKEEKLGFKKFVEVGCSTCHNGAAVGGAMYQKLGLVKAWPNLTDEGRSAVTKNDAEKFFFKVPSLRNIDKTGPYLHDGSITDLGEMVEKMAEYQLGQSLSKADTKSIVTFLKSLTGDLPTDYIKEPKLPASGPNTPKADPN